MDKIRVGVFETNSSSTHVCILATSSIIDDWKNGDLVYAEYPNNRLLGDLPDDAFVSGEFIKREYFDKITIKTETSCKITFKDLIDLWNHDKTEKDIWGDKASDVIEEIKSHNYYGDDDYEHVSSEDIICLIDSEAIELYTYDMFFNRYSDLEHNKISRNLDGVNVEVLSWDGYEG